MMSRFLLNVGFLLLLSPSVSFSEQFNGRIIHVADGDTVTLLTESKQKIRIRISGIDAPEKAQPYGNRSKQNLERLAHSKDAFADCPKKDKYKRHVCKVLVDNIDVGLQQIRDGFAWWYRAYSNEQSAEARTAYENAEIAASKAAIGLWKDDSSVPPWEWRKSQKRLRQQQ